MKKIFVLGSFVLSFAMFANAEMYNSCYTNLDYNLKNEEGKVIQFHGLAACVAGKHVFLSGEKDPKIVALTGKSCRCSGENTIITMSN